MRGIRRASLLTVAAACLALPALAAAPGRVNFQGLLLDSGGQPLNAVVDLDFALYPTASGGTAVWSESKPAVTVTDGIYDVELGATTPLTPEILVGGTLFLEVTVEGEVLTPRRELLAVPYAVRAAEAESVGGVAAAFVTEFFEHRDLDNNGVPNAAEGLGDLDSDGEADFIDLDNDADGLSDGAEAAQGSDMNLVTPTIMGFQPTALPEDAPATVTITGTNFDEPDLAVSFGSQTPTPTNVTPTSFDVVVGPQAPGSVGIAVSLGNGETAPASTPFLFRKVVTAFVTSTTHNGGFGGLAGGDQICATRAAAAGLSGTYLAWLRANNTSAATRFSYPGNSAIFRRTDGVQFNDPTATTLPLDAPFDRDESGAAVAAGELVWTGGGSLTGQTCNEWTSGIVLNGTAGAVGDTGAAWQAGSGGACSSLHHLYCFEQ